MRFSKLRFIVFLGLVVLILGMFMNFFNPQIFSGPSLLVYSGIVENFSETIEIRKEGNPHDQTLKESTTTTFVAKFRIQDQEIIAQFPKSVRIKDGDQISVCGEKKNARLNVLTFKNHTQNISQNSSNWWVNIVIGGLFLCVTFYMYFYVVESPMIIEQLVAIAFTFAGFYLIYRGLVVQKAISMLEISL